MKKTQKNKTKQEMDIKVVDLESVRQLRNIQIVITSLCINQ